MVQDQYGEAERPEQGGGDKARESTPDAKNGHHDQNGHSSHDTSLDQEDEDATTDTSPGHSPDKKAKKMKASKKKKAKKEKKKEKKEKKKRKEKEKKGKKKRKEKEAAGEEGQLLA